MKRRPPYSEEVVAQFMAACTSEERALFDFFLTSMAREREGALCRVGDLDFVRGGVNIRTRVDEQVVYERFVPISSDVMTRLRQHCRGKEGSSLVFPPQRKNRMRRIDSECKKVAKRAGFTDWKEFTMHRWRRTGAFRLLKSGVCLREIQTRLGHVKRFETLDLLDLERVEIIRPRGTSASAAA